MIICPLPPFQNPGYAPVDGQLVDYGPGFLAAVCHADVFDKVLQGSSTLLRLLMDKILACLDGIRKGGVFIVQLDVAFVPGSSVTSKARGYDILQTRGISFLEMQPSMVIKYM